MRRLNGLDAAFLYGETASWHMHVSGVVIVDPNDVADFGIEKLRRQLGERLALVPQFRERIVGVPLGIDRPVAVQDPDFDLDYHVRRIACPSPGGDREFGELVGELVSHKLDRSRPLWEMWLVEGLADGRVALVAKIHHAIIDGVSGLELATVLLDIEKNPAPPPALEAGPELAQNDDADSASASDAEREGSEPEADEIPSDTDLFLQGLVRLATTPMRVSRLTGQLVRQGATFANHLLGSNAPAAPFSAPMTRLNRRVTPHRRFAFSTLSLDEMKTVKNSFNVKLNDVVLAVCAGALRRYLEGHEELPASPLIAQVPVSLRTEATKGEVGNRVGNMFASLHTNIEDPAKRLVAIAEGTKAAKLMQQALEADKIMNLTDTTPPGLISLAAQGYTAAGLEGSVAPVFNLIISNVPGPPFDLYSLGARVEGLFPMGPLVFGTGLNITVTSNATNMDFGLLTCRENEPDPWVISNHLEVALDELVDAAAELETAKAENMVRAKKKAAKPKKGASSKDASGKADSKKADSKKKKSVAKKNTAKKNSTRKTSKQPTDAKKTDARKTSVEKAGAKASKKKANPKKAR